MLLEELNATGKEAKLLGYELIRGLHVEHDLFSVENDLLTPTFKLKRPQLKERYLDAITKMYASMTPQP
jgi:long-chain acyl-CoA synthetase